VHISSRRTRVSPLEDGLTTALIQYSSDQGRFKGPPWRKTVAGHSGDEGGRDQGRGQGHIQPSSSLGRALPGAAIAASSRPRRSTRAACHRRNRVQPPWLLDACSCRPRLCVQTLPSLGDALCAGAGERNRIGGGGEEEAGIGERGSGSGPP
jgi:hypothetical protein